MDPYKILSRSTKLSRPHDRAAHHAPSRGPSSQPQLFSSDQTASNSRKRKRGTDFENAEIEFFGSDRSRSAPIAIQPEERINQINAASGQDEVQDSESTRLASVKSLDETIAILRKHKLKVTWLNPPAASSRSRRREKEKKVKQKDKSRMLLYPSPLQGFNELRTNYSISEQLALNIEDQGYSIPTEVQMSALPLLLDESEAFSQAHASSALPLSTSNVNLLTVAPTGSGKTLAFMIPLIQRILEARRTHKQKQASAVILAPTKELIGQIVNEGRKLLRDTGIRISQVRKGMKFAGSVEQDDPDDEVDTVDTVVKSDILVSTPGILANALQNVGRGHTLSSVRHLILDEADVLLDPLFREQTLAIWNSLPSSHLRVSLWSATMGSNIEDLARTTIAERTKHISNQSSQDEPQMPLIRLVVGLKDSAVPNIKHKLVFAASEQGKLMGLRQILRPDVTINDANPPLLPPFLVFTQTIERAVALHSELLYDIPAEAGGISRIAVLHSDLSDTARDSVMTRFRKGEIWILITTDLLSRGVDFQGINGVVNYDIPTSSAAYVHRVGRTGRAGRDGGVAVTLYGNEDMPFLKPIANLVATAQKVKGISDRDGIQPWLLDSLPKSSKNERKNLKKHGIESRAPRAKVTDPKAARKSRISTRAGFVRREENKRKGAILGSQTRQNAAFSDDEQETDFGGFE